MINRDAIKKLNDMIVDSQYAQQLGIKVFNGQGSPEEHIQLTAIATDLLSAIQIWKDLIPTDIRN